MLCNYLSWRIHEHHSGYISIHVEGHQGRELKDIKQRVKKIHISACSYIKKGD